MCKPFLSKHSQTPNRHRLQQRLRGSLIRFAPFAFVPQRQVRPRQLPSPLVFHVRSSHFNSPGRIPLSPIFLLSGSCQPSALLGRFEREKNLLRSSASELPNCLRTLYAQSYRNTCPVRLTATAGTLLSQDCTNTLPPEYPRTSRVLWTLRSETFLIHAILLVQTFVH